jgi:hypothetical protein
MQLKLDLKRVVGIFAPQNYGKTLLTHYFIEQYLKNGITSYLYDTDFEKERSYNDLHGLKVIYTKRLADMENEQSLNNLVLQLRARSGNFLFVVEDVDKVLQNSRKSLSNLEIFKLASDSRHQRIAVIYTSKTPSYIPTTLRLNTNLLLFGKFVEPLFVKAITEIIPREIYDKIKKPQFIMYDTLTQDYSIIQYDMNRNVLVND